MACHTVWTTGFLYLALALGAAASTIAGDSTSPFPAVASDAVACDEHDGQVRLYNSNVGLSIERRSGKLLGIWSNSGLQLVDNSLSLGMAWLPLWSAQVLAKNGEKPLAVDATAGQLDIETPSAAADGSRQIVMTWSDVPAGELRLSATLRIRLHPGDSLARWSMDASVSAGEGGIHAVTYPQLAVVGSDPQPQGNQKLIPYRRGTLGPFGRDSVRFDTQQPYPGPAAKFQFMATYGASTGQGVYVGAHDGEAHNKVFIQRNYADRNAIVLSIEHWPNDRATAAARWIAPYDVVAGGFQGDWYDACRIYRQWWVQQVWAGKGLVQDRADIPDWVKRAVVVTRPSTTKAERTVESNLKGYDVLLQAVPQRPIFGIWYGAFANITGAENLDSEGHGQVRPLKPGIADALAQLRQKDVHHIAYVQSLIYDPQAASNADLAAALKNVSRGPDGKEHLYGPPKLSMCRATAWWQQRAVDISVSAVRDGFEGIYLDSFGKGANECFDAGHGHSLGGGNTVIAGQRQMAQRIIDAIRAINPQAVISGEAPVEAFRDLIHVNLYAKNTWEGYAPAFRAIWGDYSLGFGRVIRAGKDGPANVIPELATLFVEGAVIGRIFTEGGGVEIAQPEQRDALRYLQLINDYALAGIDYLRFGDMLHPLKLDVPTVTFTESVENGKTTTPAILHNVFRSHTDGSAAVVLTNIGGAALTVNVPIDPAWRGSQARSEATLWQMDRHGRRTRLASGAAAWNHPLSVAPGDVVFLILQ